MKDTQKIDYRGLCSLSEHTIHSMNIIPDLPLEVNTNSRGQDKKIGLTIHQKGINVSYPIRTSFIHLGGPRRIFSSHHLNLSPNFKEKY